MKVMLQLFERMTYIYGYKWGSLMGKAVDEKGELTTAAKTWQSGLSGITTQQLAKGMERTALSNNAWCPSLPEFRAMCLHRDDVPTISEIVKILIKSYRIGANVAETYKHPIALEIALKIKNRDFEFRNSSWAKCEAMIKPIYDELLVSGWDDFKPEHYEDQKRLTATLPMATPEQREKASKVFSNLYSIVGGSI